MDGVADDAVQRLGPTRALGCEAADDLGRVADAPASVAGVHPLRAEGEVGVLADAQAGRLEHRPQHLARGARPGGRFEHDQGAGREVGEGGLGGGDDVAEVGLSVVAQRRGYADEHGATGGQACRVGRGFQRARLNEWGQPIAGHVLDVRPTVGQRLDLGHREVEAHHAYARLREGGRERQADVAEPDDADGGEGVLVVRHGQPTLASGGRTTIG